MSPKDRDDVRWWAHRLHPQLLISWGILVDDHTRVLNSWGVQHYWKKPLCVLNTVPLPTILAQNIGKSEFSVVCVMAVTHRWITTFYDEQMKELP